MKIIKGMEEIDWVMIGLPLLLIMIVLFNMLGLIDFFPTFFFLSSLSLIFIWYCMQDRETIFNDVDHAVNEVNT